MVTPNIICSIAGEPKTGKSHLALTFPAKLVVFSLDVGIDPVLAKFKGKDIEVKMYPLPIIDSVKGTGMGKEILAIWRQMNDDIKAATEDPEVKSIVIDTATALYELARIARAAELGQENLLQFQYGDVYARMKAIIQRPRIAGQNLVLTHYLRDKYIKEQNTGEKELDGWRHTEGEVDLVLVTRRELKTEKGGKKKSIIVTTIKDNRYDLALNGVELEMATYDDLAALVGGE